MIDTDDTDEIICPYCAYQDKESYADNGGDEGEFATGCVNCGRIIIADRTIEVTYSTRKPTSKRRVIYGTKPAKCAVCGETGGVKVKSDVCECLVCSVCAAADAVCCDDYRQVFDQVKEEA